jgi:hypothetical protein
MHINKEGGGVKKGKKKQCTPSLADHTDTTGTPNLRISFVLNINCNAIKFWVIQDFN